MAVLDGLTRTVVDNRWRVVLAVLAVTALAGVGLPRVGADFTPEDLFADFGDQARASAEFREAFGNTDNILIVLVQADDVLRVDVAGYVHSLSRTLAAEELSDRVDSMTTIPYPRGRFGVGTIPEGDQVTAADAEALARALADAPLVIGKLVSHDRTLAVIAVRLARTLQRNAEIDAAVRRVESMLASTTAPPGVSTSLGGLPYVRAVVIRKMKDDQGFLLPISFGLCLIVLFLSFRWIPGVVFPLVTVGIAAAMVVGAMGWAGIDFDIINNIVPVLIVIIGISDSIHLISRYIEELRAGKQRDAAVRQALRSMAVACLFTSFTTAVGFASLAASRTSILKAFGMIAALGIALAYAVTITMLPALLSLVKPPVVAARDDEAPPALERLVGWLIRRRHWVLIGSLVVGVAAAAVAWSIRVDENVLSQFDRDEPISKTLYLLEDKLEGVRPVEVSLRSDTIGRFDDPDVLEAVDRVKRWGVERDDVLGANTYADYLREARYVLSGNPGAREEPLDSRLQINALAALFGTVEQSPISSFVNEDRTRLRLNFQLADVGAKATLEFARDLNKRLDAELGKLDGVRWELAGEGYVSSRGLDALIEDLLRSLIIAVVLIFGFLSLLFRSLRLGLLSLPPNLLPLLLSLAYMAVRDIPLSTATVIIFSISIGLAVDGTIHVLARLSEEMRAGRSVEQALRRAANGTGKAIVATCLTLMIGFGVLQLSAFVPVRRFGELIAVTVGGCLISTILMLPPLLYAGTKKRA